MYQLFIEKSVIKNASDMVLSRLNKRKRLSRVWRILWGILLVIDCSNLVYDIISFIAPEIETISSAIVIRDLLTAWFGYFFYNMNKKDFLLYKEKVKSLKEDISGVSKKSSEDIVFDIFNSLVGGKSFLLNLNELNSADANTVRYAISLYLWGKYNRKGLNIFSPDKDEKGLDILKIRGVDSIETENIPSAFFSINDGSGDAENKTIVIRENGVYDIVDTDKIKVCVED